jgi:cytoskeletal protein CcmA (bactofilin family)
MFNGSNGQKTPTARRAAPARDANAVTILTSGCHFSGKMYCRGASRIGGKIEGQIVSEGLLVIEDEAVIDAEIKAEEVIIQGRVHGKLVASSRVELCASSHFEGEVTTPVLVVREGALFNGNATMARKDGQDSRTPRIVSKGGQRVDGSGPEINAPAS